VVSKLEGRVPPEVSILIDLEGAWRKGFGLDTSVPNVMIFDADGRMVHRFEGRVSPRAARLAAERIGGLRRQAGGGRR